MSGMDKVLDRIQKLRRLSQSSNVHEAAAAAAEAQRLMSAHHVAEAQLQAERGQLDERVESADVLAASGGGKWPLSWLVKLAMGIADANGCRVTTTGAQRNGAAGAIHMYGQPSRLQAASYMFQVMRGEIIGLASSYGARQHSVSTAFKMGAAVEIGERMVAEKRAAEIRLRQASGLGHAQATGALMVIDRALVAVKAEVERVATGKRNIGGPSNWDAFQDGRRAGSKVDLGGGKRGIGAPAKQLEGARS